MNHAFVQIEGAPAVDAFLIQGSRISPAVFTPKGCIAVGSRDKGSRLMARDRETKSLGLLVDLGALPPGVMRFRLTADNAMNRFNMEAKCPSSSVAVAREFMPTFRSSEARQVTFPFATMTIRSESQTVLQKNLILGAQLQPIPLDLPDGVYTLELRAFDAFDRLMDATGPVETCRLTVDKGMPSLSLKTAAFPLVEGQAKVHKVSPGARLEFTIADQNATDVFLCLKQRKDETVQADGCTEDEYRNVGSFYNAPDEGAWDLYAYALDGAGNRSETMHSTFFVYHEALISEIRTLSRTISDYVQTRQEFKAFKSYQHLVSLAKTLVLQAEITDIYWQLMSHFLWASGGKHLIAEYIIPEAHFFQDSVAVSPYHDAWVISAAFDYSYLYQDNQLTTLKNFYHRFAFLDRDRMVGVRPTGPRLNGTALDFFEHGKVVKTFEFDDFIETMVLDKRRQAVVLGHGSRLILVDYAEGYKERPPVPLPLPYNQGTRYMVQVQPAPDSSYYFVVRDHMIVRIDPDVEGSASVYADPGTCSIGDYQARSASELFYLVKPNFSGSECTKLNRVVWTNDEPKPEALGPDAWYAGASSFLLTPIDGKPYLLFFKSDALYGQDLTMSGVAPKNFYANAPRGRLVADPQQADTVYAFNQEYASRIRFKSSFGDIRAESLSLSLEMSKLNHWVPMLSSKPGEFYLFGGDGDRIERFSFAVADEVADGPLSCQNRCDMTVNGNYTLELSDAHNLLWADVPHGTRVRLHQDQEILGQAIMEDGTVVFATADKKGWTWRPQTKAVEEIGTFDLQNIHIRYFPLVDLLTFSNDDFDKVSSGVLDWTSTVETYILKRAGQAWQPVGGKRQGLAASQRLLPILPFIRLDGRKLWVDVVSQQGEVLNAIEMMTLAKEPFEVNGRRTALANVDRFISIHKDVLFSTCRGILEAFELYTGKAKPLAYDVPQGYQTGYFRELDWIELKGGDPDLDRDKSMNVVTGAIADINESLRKRQIAKGTVATRDGFRDQWGEVFALNGDFFPTSDPFVMGYKDGSRLSVGRVDPHWIDAQLQKSLLYHTKF